jgi:hypothetical protein
MRLPEPRLPRQQRHTQRPSLYPAQQFKPEMFVHLSKVHLWIIRHRQ